MSEKLDAPAANRCLSRLSVTGKGLHYYPWPNLKENTRLANDYRRRLTYLENTLPAFAGIMTTLSRAFHGISYIDYQNSSLMSLFSDAICGEILTGRLLGLSSGLLVCQASHRQCFIRAGWAWTWRHGQAATITCEVLRNLLIERRLGGHHCTRYQSFNGTLKHGKEKGKSQGTSSIFASAVKTRQFHCLRAELEMRTSSSTNVILILHLSILYRL